MPTEIACLDAYLNGCQVMAVAAQSKVGMTVFASTISFNLELAGVPHLFATLERYSDVLEEIKITRRLGARGFDSPHVD